jgi:Cu/Ag efflux pump CusA
MLVAIKAKQVFSVFVQGFGSLLVGTPKSAGSSVMISGMVPMAIGASEGGAQAASLGRAVIGGLAVATFTTLTVLPACRRIRPE